MLISQVPVNRGCWVTFSANIQPTDHTSTGVEYFKPSRSSDHQTKQEFDPQLQSISPSIFLIPHSDHHRKFWGREDGSFVPVLELNSRGAFALLAMSAKLLMILRTPMVSSSLIGEEVLFPSERFGIRAAVFRVSKTVGVGGKPFLSVEIEHLQAYDLENWNCAYQVIESVVMIAGDQAAFWGCGFFGAQDTLHDDRGHHYFKDCYIQGSIDFIFGNARSLYKLSSIANPVALGAKVINGVVTAHGRASKDESSGFAFVNCSVGGTGRIWLGRA
ncbi:hypothetical protein HYC85_012342 [Camellia sinensis]|uniref:Pectinesterase n=1 Tax=Camellia sinensis TaxID=4442 RepID=A0A7J7HCA4_CAMSI|nr:hypothetical protein HYC85_012342 [Camellia sinensis]